MSNLHKVIPELKPADIPPFDSIREIGMADRRKYGLIMSNGGLNDYRIAIATGFGGSCKEETWDKTAHLHTCCSKVPWRHKVNCPRLKFEDEL